ncbi:hypothetical protein KEJ47_09415 [Candidatus Bathyarchaeota archaeon]|nr:hypothetical protein [Candidatus Bathyarchaeota archaeon]
MRARIDAGIKRITFLAKRLVRSKRVFTYSYSSTVAEALRGSKPRAPFHFGVSPGLRGCEAKGSR